ncbi:hypothetical protein EVAR_22395_1 [Eumeta japonica]|uniref:Mariner Mos1 transposase n=1 Tax=Eumeta variegata TaxID=151549 RepID=A0A4C1VIG8_EUMVA|nr:hypothetical protein EVAR_22395_1 [Eumeta japonica]
MLTPFDKQRLQTRVHALDEKGEKPRNSRFKSRIEAYGDNFGIVKAREAVVQKRREVIARSAVLQDNASVHTARVSRQALKDTGFGN